MVLKGSFCMTILISNKKSQGSSFFYGIMNVYVNQEAALWWYICSYCEQHDWPRKLALPTVVFCVAVRLYEWEGRKTIMLDVIKVLGPSAGKGIREQKKSKDGDSSCGSTAH